MELWIRSTSRTNLIKVRFLTIMEGKNFYKESDWEYRGYTICNCEYNSYEILGTYKTKERAIEVLGDIQNMLRFFKGEGFTGEGLISIENNLGIYQMPKE